LARVYVLESLSLAHDQKNLINVLACESVSAPPERTLRTWFTVGVVNAFLVWASDNAIKHRNGNDLTVLHKILNFPGCLQIRSNISII
jgi:hypothetical protein